MDYVVKLPDADTLNIDVSDDVFKPTYTSDLCIKAAYSSLDKPKVILDLGCGSGVVGLSLAKLGLVKGELYASDLSQHAVELTKENAKALGIEVSAKAGSLFEPWQGMEFECIVDDVSGIAESVANLSPWFSENIPCFSGNDGADLTCHVLETAGEYLSEGGLLFFPSISLSNTKRILACANTHFQSVELAAEQLWQLPKEMLVHAEHLRELKSEGLIDFEEKFGMIICKTAIYQCS